MSGCCHGPGAPVLRAQRWALGVALAINLAMFVIEAIAGWAAESVALQADALDFFGDSVNYAVALFVLARSLAWRAGTALAKGLVMAGFGLFILGATLVNAVSGSAPEALVMGWVGALALLANIVAALFLFRFRNGDANMRAVWLCSRNDAIGNIAVVAAGLGVFATGTAWPDLAVGLVMAFLALWAGQSVIRQSRAELRRPGIAAT